MNAILFTLVWAIVKYVITLAFNYKFKQPKDGGDIAKPVPTTYVEDVIKNPSATTWPWYLTKEVRLLLAAIRKFEGGKAGYNADYANNNNWYLFDKTFDQVRALSRSQVTKGKEASSAIGAYQFLTKTLDSLKTSLRLTGGELFVPEFQDDLAVALMIRRGFLQFVDGAITAEVFANNLAKEWASLPVVTNTQGARRWLKKGQSYYAGDGLNKAHHDPDAILDLIRAVGRTTHRPKEA